MVRKPPSSADVALIDAAAARGAVISATQLERWRRAGLLPDNRRHGAGQGRGSTSTAPAGIIDLVVWLSAHARPGRRPHHVALEAFGAGLPVPEATVRAAWRSTITDLGVGPAPVPESGTDRSEWIAETAERFADKHSRNIMLMPRRVRDIDTRITDLGLSWAPAGVAQYDRGTHQTDPFTSRDFVTLAMSAVLGGSSELNGANLAAFSRALSPEGAVSAVASMLEYPDGNPDLADINDGQGLSLLPTGDLRDDLDQIITEASPAHLYAAWHSVDAMHTWAVTLCDQVEAELDLLAAGRSQQDYPALLQWYHGIILGPHRLLLRQALQKTDTSPAARAGTAVMLLAMATGMSRLRVMMPDSQFELLPVLLPPFLEQLAAMIAADPPTSLRTAPADQPVRPAGR
ncbi:hypothetical protein [Actinoplanes sp. NPDC026670]|uniref:hypothetical protein n=1 Tax=Actinoplanes sp. NPDC026670 TaxID=3154700 RepID=UPI0033F964F1